MIADNIKKLLFMIFLVLLLLGVCIHIDYAEDNITVNESITVDHKINATNTTLLNGTYYSVEKDTGVAKLQSVVTEKPKLPLVTITAKPSVRSNYAYKWYTRTWVNYCPNCKHYNVLLINPKGVPERELSCKRCSSDFCGVTGKEKYSWSKVYLKKG